MIDRLTDKNISYTQRKPSIDSGFNPLQQGQDIRDSRDEQNSIVKNKGGEEEKIQEVIKGINDFLQPTNTSIKFVLHEKLDDYYVNIVDDKTKEVIKEIPSKKLLDTHAKMMEFVGLMVDEKA